MSTRIYPTTWEAFWMHVDDGKIARFNEKTSWAKVEKSSNYGWYYFSFDYDLPDGDGDGLGHEYSRGMLQAWLDDKFQPNDWSISNE